MVGPRARGARSRCAAATPRRRWRSATRDRAAPTTCRPAMRSQAELIAVEALLALGRQRRGASSGSTRSPSGLLPAADERHLGRVPAAARAASTPTAGRVDRGVSRLRPERQRVRAARRAIPGRPQLPRARASWPPRRARGRARRGISPTRIAIFESLGAQPDLAETRAALAARADGRRRAASSASQMDGDDALVRRIVDAAVMPALLAREGATTLLEACDAPGGGDLHAAACGRDSASSSAAGLRRRDGARAGRRGRAIARRRGSRR